MNAIEITHLINNIETNGIGCALIIVFSQIAKSQQVRRYFERGRDIASKHMEIFGSILREDYLNTLMSWDVAVQDTTVSPFSDKLMMSHITAMSAAGIGNYGAAISASQRHDLGATLRKIAC